MPSLKLCKKCLCRKCKGYFYYLIVIKQRYAVIVWKLLRFINRLNLLYVFMYISERYILVKYTLYNI